MVDIHNTIAHDIPFKLTSRPSPALARKRLQGPKLPKLRFRGKNIFGSLAGVSNQRTQTGLRQPPQPPPNFTMASRHANRALRTSLRQLSNPRIQQRTFALAAHASRPTLQKAANSAFMQQTRGKKTVDFAGDKEVVYGKSLAVRKRFEWALIHLAERDDWPRDKLLVRVSASIQPVRG